MFPRRDIERTRLLAIAATWRLIGARRAPLNAPAEWNGWRIINPDDYERERYASRAAAGLCTRCGKAPSRPGCKTCEGCAAAQRDRAAAMRARRRGAGLCIQCGRPSDGAARCETCRRDYRPGGRWPGSDSRRAAPQ